MAVCYRCGASFEGIPIPVGRRETCAKCGFDVKVCRNCKHYDARSYNECREPMAERVVDKERSNVCDYFVLGSGAGGTDESAEALKRLNDLFKK